MAVDNADQDTRSAAEEQRKANETEDEFTEKAVAESKNGDIIDKETAIAAAAEASARPYEIKLSREKKKAIIERGINESRPIFAEDTPMNKFATNVRKVTPKAGFYDVALHGRETNVDFLGTTIDAYTLAQIIMQRADYIRGTPVRLLSCNTGNTSNTGDCVAQLLANELDVIVEAPTETLYVFDDGETRIGVHGEGYFKLFYSRKAEEE